MQHITFKALGLVSLICVIGLSACSKDEVTPVQAPETKHENPILDPAVRALEKARGVEATLQEAENKRQKDMQDMGI